MKGRFCGLMFVLLLLPQWSKESQDKGLFTETCLPQLFDYFFVPPLPGERPTDTSFPIKENLYANQCFAYMSD